MRKGESERLEKGEKMLGLVRIEGKERREGERM